MTISDLKKAIRNIPDFPEKGIQFKDITPVLSNAELFRFAVTLFEQEIADKGITKIAAIDARGFFFGAALCERLAIGLVPIRKQGKLPYKTYEESYDLEYGSATLAIHQDAFNAGEKVVLIDDLLATGGTAAASARLIEKAGGKVVQIQFLVELAFLNGRELLSNYETFAPIVF